MVMGYGATAVLSGLVGYAIGRDGRLQPVSQEAINRLLRDTKPEFITKVDIDTSVARDGNELSGEYPISGSFILILNPTTPTVPVYIKLNEPGWPPLPLTSLRRLVGPFYRFFIKNAVGVGTLNLIITRGYQFQLIEGEVAAKVSQALNDLTDVSVAAPTDLYILYWNATNGKWECRAFTNWLHKIAHQDGGTDEISVALLSGELADRQKSKCGDSALGWTLDKFLLGAGAGVNPTEVDPSAVGPTKVRKTANESVTSSTTLQNDDHLLLAVGANEVWYIFLIARVTTLAAAGFKFAFTVPLGGSLKGIYPYLFSAISATAQFIVAYDLTVAHNVLTATNTADYWVVIWAIYVGGANAGNVQFQWAQDTADATATQVLANSILIAHKIA